MSAIYYRRWTRMYLHPATKYFQKYDVITQGVQHLKHLENVENPYPENKWYIRKSVVDHEEEINTKLVNKLFLKYPDLKYESISRQKFGGDNYNSYSYSYAFITEQKKLMKAGYSMNKAFEIVEEKFQEKIKRKLDQTLVSRGLAISNRARSLLTIYQQQVEEESRLKMLRTKRQVKKYEQKLDQIEKSLNKQNLQEDKEEDHYERIFHKITNDSIDQINKQAKTEKRYDMINRVESDFKNMFKQFYETASYRDRLRGLTDDEIKQQINSSPTKIKRLSRELVNYLRSKGNISIDSNGELRMSEGINQNLRAYIYSSPTMKMAILNDLIGYENPIHSVKTRMEQEARSKLSELRNQKPEPLSPQKKDAIKQSKIKELSQVVETEVPADVRAYRLLQTSEQRLLRLQIKYLSSFLRNDKNINEDVIEKLKNVIQDFRRLKFRMQKRYVSSASEQLAFPEHYVLGRRPSKIEQMNTQYEDLLQYLRKKTEDRRLKAIDQADDNKINERILKQACNEVPISEGEIKTHN